MVHWFTLGIHWFWFILVLNWFNMVQAGAMYKLAWFILGINWFNMAQGLLSCFNWFIPGINWFNLVQSGTGWNKLAHITLQIPPQPQHCLVFKRLPKSGWVSPSE